MADMQLTEQRKKEIKAQFARRRRNQLLLLIPLGVAILVATFVDLDPLVHTLGYVVVVVGYIGFSLYNWRCPACGKLLGSSYNPEFCSKCGAQLRT